LRIISAYLCFVEHPQEHGEARIVLDKGPEEEVRKSTFQDLMELISGRNMLTVHKLKGKKER
jgi:hypothetical protein